MLQTFVKKRSFLDLLHAIDIIVATAKYTHHTFAFQQSSVLRQRGDRQCTGRFRYDCIFVVQLKYCCTYFSFRNKKHVANKVFADGERKVSDFLNGSTVNKSLDVVAAYGFAGFECLLHGRSSRRFHAYQLRLWRIRFEVGTYASA